jgi:hypothetical protein
LLLYWNCTLARPLPPGLSAAVAVIVGSLLFVKLLLAGPVMETVGATVSIVKDTTVDVVLLPALSTAMARAL